MPKSTCSNCNDHGTESTDQLKINQARLWVSHYWSTREVIRDAVSNSPCLTIDLTGLYVNQDKLGLNFGKLTTKRGGRKLANALRDHITIAVEIVVATIQGKPIDQLYKTWSLNATDIAEIYHKYNHQIQLGVINKLMQEHLKTTLDEAIAIISGDCQKSAATGTIALGHVNMMADYINSKFH